jgi:glycosyltransferase involved in cell wall biosynthesis
MSSRSFISDIKQMNTGSHKSKMIRVGIVVSFSDNWIGGLNYYKNLINAMYELSDRKIDFIIFTNKNSKLEHIAEFSKVQIVRSSMFDRLSLLWLIRKFITHCFNTEPLLISLLKKYKIDILSHSGGLGKKSSIPTIGWIPDFQHIHLPSLFSKENRYRRDREFNRISELCSKIILSSKDAEKDMHQFAPASIHKTVVMNFAINPSIANSMEKMTPLSVLEDRYQFSGSYFLLPNQFWIHKNHEVVVQALNILKPKCPDILIIVTGNTLDPRNPTHFENLMQEVTNKGLRNNFKVCGIIPTEDLYALMHHATAIINPSFFEGWSTTVEEAKVFGKAIILSDIPVHKEQDPPYAAYFDPKDPIELAQLLKTHVYGINHPTLTGDHYILAKQRYKKFGETYQTVVEQLFNSRE